MVNTNFTFTKTENESIRKFIEKANKDSKQELEVRIGNFRKRDNRFFPGVNIETFDKLSGIINKWADNKVFEYSITVDVSFGSLIKRTDVIDNEGQIVGQYWKTKSKSLNKPIDIEDHNIRIDLSEENLIEEPKTGNPTFYRRKERTSYVVGLFRYDLTSVNEAKTIEELNRPMMPLDYKYEVEIEYIGNKFQKKEDVPNAKDVLEELRKTVEAVVKSLQDNFFILTKTQKDKVVDEYKKLTGFRHFKPVGSQPFTLLKGDLSTLEEGYSVTEKTDGDRSFLFIDSIGDVYIIKSSLEIIATGLQNKKHKNTLYDGEYLKSNQVFEKDATNLYLAFDIVIHKNKDYRDDTSMNLFKRRDEIGKTLSDFTHLDVNNPGFFTKVMIKNFLTEGNIFENSRAILDFFFNPKNAIPYKTDGLIYTPINEPYFSQTPKNRNQKTYKWKPAELNTIDFHAEAVGVTEDNLFEIWHLRMATTTENAGKFNASVKTTIRPSNINTVFDRPVRLFQPESQLNAFETFVPFGFLSETGQRFYPDTIIEFKFDKKTKMFIPLRTRWDKTFSRKGANFEATAIDVWETITKPISFDVITGRKSVQSESTSRPKISRETRTDIRTQKERLRSSVINLRRFHNYIKREMLETLGKDSEIILDLASGKGGDLSKYPQGSRVIGFDIDSDSVDEANSRAKESLSQGRIKGKFDFFVLDLSKGNVIDFIKTKPRLPNTDFDLVNSQFAFHFFFKTEKTLRNYLKNVSDNLKEGGIFMGTAFDGRKVFEMLKNKKTGESIEGKEKGRAVYKITKRYSDKVKSFDKLPMFGQKISALLAGDTVMSRETDEYLINFEKLEKIAKEFDLDFLGTVEFDEYFKDWKENDKKNRMFDAEKEYSFLNVSFTFRKTTKSLIEKQKEESETITVSELIKELSETEKESEPEQEESEPEEEDEWEDLSKTWQKKLKSKSFVKRECGGGGDCQFLSIAFALNSTGEFNLTNKKLRRLIAKEIKKMTDDEFDFIITNYRLEQEEGRFEGDWDPDTIETKDELISEIKKEGFNFQGDDITISLISKALDIDFIILNNRSKTIYKSEGDKKNDNIVVLFFTGDGGHYQLVGLEDPETGEIDTLFERDDLHEDLETVMKISEEIPRKKAKKTKKEKKSKSLERKPCGDKEPRLKRDELVDVAKRLGVKSTGKKNMNKLCKESKDIVKEKKEKKKKPRRIIPMDESGEPEPTSNTKIKKLIQRKPCGTKDPKLTRKELETIAKELGITSIAKKNMNKLCEEIKDMMSV